MKTIRIGIVGRVDAGKTSLTGILTKLKEGEYDDGRGYARSLVFTHKHEQESGRTSSITREAIIKNDRIYEFVDLAGHEMYLRTTISGLCGHNIDYVILVIGGNMGIDKMTREHLMLAMALNIPIMVVISKIDLAPEEVLKDTIKRIKTIIKANKCFSHIMKSEEEFKNNAIQQFTKEKLAKLFPMFLVSNKTGDGIPLLKSFLAELDPLQKFNPSSSEISLNIHSSYSPTGIGLVVSGILQSGTIHRGDVLQLGPIIKRFVKVKVWSIHDDFRQSMESLTAGMTGSLAIKIIDKEDKSIITRDDICRGCKIVSQVRSVSSFLAQVLIFNNHSTTIAENYEPLLNCITTMQTAIILKVHNPQTNEPILRTMDRGEVVFKFKYHPEYVEIGNIFLLREGKTKGYGKILEILS